MKEVKQILIGNTRKQQKNKGRGTVQDRKDRFVFKEIGVLEGKKAIVSQKSLWNRIEMMSQGEDKISELKNKVAELEQSDTKIKQWEGTSGNSNIHITSSKDHIYE